MPGSPSAASGDGSAARTPPAMTRIASAARHRRRIAGAGFTGSRMDMLLLCPTAGRLSPVRRGWAGEFRLAASVSVQILLQGDDPNVLVCREIQHRSIAGYDEFSACRQRAFQNAVIGFVRENTDPRSMLNEFSD